MLLILMVLREGFGFNRSLICQEVSHSSVWSRELHGRTRSMSCSRRNGQAILVLPWALRRAKAGYSYTCDGVGENENLQGLQESLR